MVSTADAKRWAVGLIRSGMDVWWPQVLSVLSDEIGTCHGRNRKSADDCMSRLVVVFWVDRCNGRC